MRPGRAVRPAGRRLAPRRRADRRAARALESDRPREDRAAGNRPREPVRVPPRLPGPRARCRLRLRALDTSPGRRERADRVRARRDGSRPPREARAPVLVLLHLQRLQQHTRGRLGDDPARLRRRRRERGSRPRARLDRLQLSRGRGAGGLGRRQARCRRRDASRRLPECRLARQQVHRGVLSRQLRRGGRRLRRHARPASRAAAGCRDDPERPGRRPRRVSRGSTSRDGGASSRRHFSTGRPART